MQESKKVRKQASRQASGQASGQASRKASGQASGQASRKASMQELRGHSVGAMPWRGLFLHYFNFSLYPN